MSAKRLLVLLLTACICLLAFSGCSDRNAVPQDELSSKENIVLPPARIGISGETEGRLARSYTFSEAYEASGVVAIIEIGNWICESEEHFCTFFEASPISVYKGELPQSFVISQLGYSEYTVSHYPLFSYGEKLLVFLSAYTEKLDDLEVDDFVFLIGDYSTVAYIAEDGSGNTYLMDWLGVVGNSVPGAKNFVGDPDIYKELKRSFGSSSDIIGVGNSREFQSVILLDDFERAVQNLSQLPGA